MKHIEELRQENEALRDRLSKLSEASLRINESLELDAVLQGVLDSGRRLTKSRYAAMTIVDDLMQVEDFLTSGITDEELQRLSGADDGMRLFKHFIDLSEPVRVSDFGEYLRFVGLPEFRAFPVTSFLAVSIHHRGKKIGYIHLGKREPGEEFTWEDEETMVMFASQAAGVIANARHYRDEQRAKADLEALLDTSPVGVAVFDAKRGEAVSFNQEAERILGTLRTPDHPLEQLPEVLTVRRADGRELSLQELTLAQALRTAETVRAEELVLQSPDGRSVAALVNVTPIRSEDGEIGSVVATLQDMTQVEELARLRAEFLAMVSHELRAPLTSVKGSITTLLDPSASLDPAETVQFHRIIDEQTDRMRKLISDLLDVARIEMGMLSVSPEPSNMAALVDQARNTFLSGGGTNTLRINIAPDLPWVMADRLRIVQVLNNLLFNAALHSLESSTILVSAVQKEVYVAVSVSDEGKGLSAERLPHLFREFSGIKGDEGGGEIVGSGLGLSICKGIVEAHGGRIWAESEGLGKGARFIFTIPVVEEGATQAATGQDRPSRPSRHPTPHRSRILAVDDDPQALRYVRDSLSKSGYEPIVSGEPEEALRLIEEERPDLVLLDLMLPGTDGIEMMKEILERGEVPIIFLSAYGQEEIVAKAFDMGAADYVVKPFSPTELAARIRAALRKQMPFESAESYVLGDLTIDYARRAVTLSDRPVRFTAIEYRMLVELSANAGRVLTYDHLLRRVWGLGNNGDLRPMRTVVSSIRHKLGDEADNPKYIFTESRIGYRMARGQGRRS